MAKPTKKKTRPARKPCVTEGCRGLRWLRSGKLNLCSKCLKAHNERLSKEYVAAEAQAAAAPHPAEEPATRKLETIHKENVLETPKAAPVTMTVHLDTTEASAQLDALEAKAKVVHDGLPWTPSTEYPADPPLRKLLIDIALLIGPYSVRKGYGPTVEVQTRSVPQCDRLFRALNPGCPHPFGLLERRGHQIFISAPFVKDGKHVWGAVKDNGERDQINVWPGA